MTALTHRWFEVESPPSTVVFAGPDPVLGFRANAVLRRFTTTDSLESIARAHLLNLRARYADAVVLAVELGRTEAGRARYRSDVLVVEQGHALRVTTTMGPCLGNPDSVDEVTATRSLWEEDDVEQDLAALVEPLTGLELEPEPTSPNGDTWAPDPDIGSVPGLAVVRDHHLWAPGATRLTGLQTSAAAALFSGVEERALPQDARRALTEAGILAGPTVGREWVGALATAESGRSVVLRGSIPSPAGVETTTLKAWVTDGGQMTIVAGPSHDELRRDHTTQSGTILTGPAATVPHALLAWSGVFQGWTLPFTTSPSSPRGGWASAHCVNGDEGSWERFRSSPWSEWCLKADDGAPMLEWVDAGPRGVAFVLPHSDGLVLRQLDGPTLIDHVKRTLDHPQTFGQ